MFAVEMPGRSACRRAALVDWTELRQARGWQATFGDVRHPPGIGEQTPQKPDIAGIEIRTQEQSPELAHRGRRRTAFVKIDCIQSVCQLRKETLELGVGRGRFAPNLMPPGHAIGRDRDRQLIHGPTYTQFVCQYLDGGRQIQGAVVGVCGNMHSGVAKLEFVVVQPGPLAAEHERHLIAGFDRDPTTLGGLARMQGFERDPAAAGGATEHQPTVGDSLRQVSTRIAASSTSFAPAASA